MFCQFCGKEVAEGETCGCANEREAMEGEAAAEKKKGGAAAFIVAAIIAVAAMVTLIVLLVMSAGVGYKKPVEQVVTAFNEGDGELLVDAVCTKKMLRYFDKERNWEYEDVCDEFEDLLDEVADELEDDFGDDVKLSVKFGDKYELDEDEIEEIEDEYRDSGYRVKIDKAYELECNLEITGEDESNDEDTDLIVIKVKDEGWKLYINDVV